MTSHFITLLPDRYGSKWNATSLITDMTKNLELEKKKVDKLKDTLTKTEEELKILKKVRSFSNS